jgi:hypothetical protein
MPRVSFSSDYLLGSPCYNTFDRYYRTSSSITEPSVLSPNEIDEILSRKLYNQLKTTSELEKGENFKQKSESFVTPVIDSATTDGLDPELILLIDRFFNLTYLNTIPMVNLLATAVIVLCIY